LSRTLTLIVLASLLAGCAVASASTQTYTVQPGDTLARIAAAHDTTVDRLVETNKETHPSLVTDPGAIEVGWKLKVPGNNGGIQVTVKKTPSLGSGPTAAPLDRDAFEIEVVRLVNTERVKAGLAPLEVDPGLMQFARERSEDMVARGYFGHDDPVTGESLTGDKGEIITKLLRTTALSRQNTDRALANWRKSSEHYRIMMIPELRRTGVGISVGDNHVVVTQVFKY
jgi:uncharacterized protein YkwD